MMKIENNMGLSDYLRKVSDRSDVPLTQSQRVNSSRGEELDRATSNPDKVEISERSKEINRIRELIEKIPEVREDKVNELREAIDKGVYNIKGEIIAENIIKKSIIDTVT